MSSARLLGRGTDKTLVHRRLDASAARELAEGAAGSARRSLHGGQLGLEVAQRARERVVVAVHVIGHDELQLRLAKVPFAQELLRLSREGAGGGRAHRVFERGGPGRAARG